MTVMLSHPDSPYIRCIGFLYLRYASDPAGLFDWFYPFLYDEERVRIASNPAQPESTVGEYCRSLLTEMNYYSTLLPRMPVQIEREVKVKLIQAEEVEERAKKNMKQLETFTRVGQTIRALYGDEENPIAWYDAVIDQVIKKDHETGEELARPKFVVTFPEYGNTETVTLGEVMTAVAEDGDKKRGRVWERGRDWDHRGEGYDNRRTRGYDRRGWDNRNDGYYDDRKRGRGYDVSRNEPIRKPQPFTNEKKLMEAVIRQERDKSAAKGKHYAQRPPTFKSSLASKQDGDVKPRRNSNVDYREYRRDQGSKSDIENTRSSNMHREKTSEELAVIQEKRRRLMQRYG